MGFSLIAAAVVLGVAVAMAVEIVTADLFPTIDHIDTAYQDLKARLDTEARANINSSRVQRVSNGTGYYDYTITIKNNGEQTLPIKQLTLLINGVKSTYSTSTTYLYPLNTATLLIYHVTTGNKRFKIITIGGIAAYDTYP